MISDDQPIPFYGDGTSIRNYSYVGDIVNGINLSIQYLDKCQDVFEVINLSGDRSVTLMEVLNYIEEGLGKKALVELLPIQPGDVSGTNADLSKARNLLGYSPKTSFEEGIKNFIQWFKTDNE
jgi:UDP-glucuronate 4-epimerase